MQRSAEVADSGIVNLVCPTFLPAGLDTVVRGGLDRVQASADIASLNVCSRLRGASLELRGGFLERGTRSSYCTSPEVRSEFGELKARLPRRYRVPRRLQAQLYRSKACLSCVIPTNASCTHVDDFRPRLESILSTPVSAS